MRMTLARTVVLTLALLSLAASLPASAWSDEADPKAEPEASPSAKEDAAVPPMPEPAGFRKISKTHDVWINLDRRMVAVDGRVCLRQGPLEMFACPQKTKEHEAVVALNSDAMTVHAALLAVGAKSGSPVQFAPEYKPATGTRIDIMVLWNDKDGKRHQAPAQQWVRHSQTKKELEYSWVFAGSSFFVDEETKQRIYQADAGDLVCVSNFPTATLDLPVESSQANAQLEFEAFTDRIPPVGTRVRLAFIARVEPKDATKPESTKPGPKDDGADKPAKEGGAGVTRGVDTGPR